MKVYLIALLFLGALVVAYSLEEEGKKLELTEQDDTQDPAEPEEDINQDEESKDEDSENQESEDQESEDQESEVEEPEVEESEDEVDKRRLRNTLSGISCRKLKRRGFCRRPRIRALCRATCRPSCRNVLSPTSCRTLRRLRKCHSVIARLYCRRTCRRCGVPPNPRNPACAGITDI